MMTLSMLRILLESLPHETRATVIRKLMDTMYHNKKDAERYFDLLWDMDIINSKYYIEKCNENTINPYWTISESKK